MQEQIYQIYRCLTFRFLEFIVQVVQETDVEKKKVADLIYQQVAFLSISIILYPFLALLELETELEVFYPRHNKGS